jgi:predicted glycogen debranching enzyme
MTSQTHNDWLASEWLEADGLGGFASGTVGGIRSRRYHALLLAATTPPTGRMVLVNGLEVWLETPAGRFALSSQGYAPDVTFPDGQDRLVEFRTDPWPRWRFCAEDGTEVAQELIAHADHPEVALRWRLLAGASARLVVRPLMSGRDYHGLHHENPGFRFEPETAGARVTWQVYPGLPPISVLANGAYLHDPTWYRNFRYDAELERGLDFVEDLASPGSFTFGLDSSDATLVLSAAAGPAMVVDPAAYADQLFQREATLRAQFASPLERAADAYVVERGQGKTIVAGYPWFTDWGRDTFIALRGFMTLPGGLELARDILLAWSEVVSEGMLPNRFPDGASEPEYNAVDASLWYVICAQEFMARARAGQIALRAAESAALERAVGAIIEGYRAGTRFGIVMDRDGLLKAGEPGWQLTWMDAKIGDWVVTPRIGKPVEIQALWLNALKLSGDEDGFARGGAAFCARFWNEQRACLFDVVDVDHEPGRDDGALRPNQILAVGGLPVALLDGERAQRVVATVEQKLLTPLGLRSLAPDEPGYRPRYGGDPRTRDSGYHQGTVWPWLIGPFVEAWLRVQGDDAAKSEADARFLQPIRDHLASAGLGHISEVADGDPPHTPGGCPFQAWSLGEYLRVSALLQADQAEPQSLAARRSA